MRACPVCQRHPRAHDPMANVQVIPGDLLHALGWRAGAYAVCHDCYAVGRRDEWTPLAEPIPGIDAALGSYYCACCHHYAREGDPIAEQFAVLRVLQEDIDAHPELTPRPKPGALRCCSECWAVWGEVVRDRWERDGVIPAETPLAALGFNLV